jgi:hypothetical protein
MIIKTFIKQPRERKDYDITYAEWLTPIADTLEEVTASVEAIEGTSTAALVIESTELAFTSIKLWVSGGTVGCVYKVTLLVQTAGTRTDEVEVLFVVEEF